MHGQPHPLSHSLTFYLYISLSTPSHHHESPQQPPQQVGVGPIWLNGATLWQRNQYSDGDFLTLHSNSDSTTTSQQQQPRESAHHSSSSHMRHHIAAAAAMRVTTSQLQQPREPLLHSYFQ
ncbi:hypothetical protein CsSME_00053195 [Camellia sinensis var. sinensis]